jgi:hypothetical protein
LVSRLELFEGGESVRLEARLGGTFGLRIEEDGGDGVVGGLEAAGGEISFPSTLKRFSSSSSS